MGFPKPAENRHARTALPSLAASGGAKHVKLFSTRYAKRGLESIAIYEPIVSVQGSMALFGHCDFL